MAASTGVLDAHQIPGSFCLAVHSAGTHQMPCNAAAPALASTHYTSKCHFASPSPYPIKRRSLYTLLSGLMMLLRKPLLLLHADGSVTRGGWGCILLPNVCWQSGCCCWGHLQLTAGENCPMLTRQRADCSMTCTAVEDRMVTGLWIGVDVLCYPRAGTCAEVECAGTLCSI